MQITVLYSDYLPDENIHEPNEYFRVCESLDELRTVARMAMRSSAVHYLSAMIDPDEVWTWTPEDGWTEGYIDCSMIGAHFIPTQS